VCSHSELCLLDEESGGGCRATTSGAAHHHHPTPHAKRLQDGPISFSFHHASTPLGGLALGASRDNLASPFGADSILAQAADSLIRVTRRAVCDPSVPQQAFNVQPHAAVRWRVPSPILDGPGAPSVIGSGWNPAPFTGHSEKRRTIQTEIQQSSKTSSVVSVWHWAKQQTSCHNWLRA